MTIVRGRNFLRNRRAFFTAVKDNRYMDVEQLLQKGVNPDSRDELGMPALFWALPHPKLVSLLLDNGADVNAAHVLIGNHSRSTTPALLDAILRGHTESARLLVERGADIEATINTGGIYATALLEATRCRNKEIMELLLDKGARIDEQDHTGASSLIRAARDGEIPLLQLLIERGAALDLTDNTGYTAEDIARREGHAEAAEMLCQAPEYRQKFAEERARTQAIAALAEKETGRRATVAEKQKFLQARAPRFKLGGP